MNLMCVRIALDVQNLNVAWMPRHGVIVMKLTQPPSVNYRDLRGSWRVPTVLGVVSNNVSSVRRHGDIAPTVLVVVPNNVSSVRRHGGIVTTRSSLGIKQHANKRRDGITSVWIALDVQKLNVIWVSRHGMAGVGVAPDVQKLNVASVRRHGGIVYNVQKPNVCPSQANGVPPGQKQKHGQTENCLAHAKNDVKQMGFIW
jgi:hypothetical protein